MKKCIYRLSLRPKLGFVVRHIERTACEGEGKERASEE